MTEKVEKGSNSTPFTENQKNCPYCHEPHKLIESDLGNFLRIGMTGGNEWDRIEPKKINGAAIHTCEAVGFDNAEVADAIGEGKHE